MKRTWTRTTKKITEAKEKDEGRKGKVRTRLRYEFRKINSEPQFCPHFRPFAFLLSTLIAGPALAHGQTGWRFDAQGVVATVVAFLFGRVEGEHVR
jgi:hypothetical protein